MNDGNRGLWVAFIVTVGLFVALVGGGLAWIGGMSAPLAILVGAGGFAGFVGLALAVMTFLARMQA
jgi:hypothetical protein